MPNWKVCVTDCRHASYEIERELLAAAGCELKLCNCATEDDLIRECGDADALLLDMVPMTERVVNALTRCKVINRYGVGYDNVAMEACTARGIRVTYVPDYCMEDVSDHALALMLSCLRHIPLRDAQVRQGSWNIHRTSFRLRGKTLGIVGAGRIGRALARKCGCFGLEEMLAYDPYISAEELLELGIRKVPFDELLERSDFVSLHLHVNEETRHMLNAEALSRMKPTAILINVSRGQLIDDAALIDALRNRRLLAAGLDTHTKEPLPADSEYFRLDNVVLTDHTAFSTLEGERELKTKSARNVIDVLSGRRPAYPVNEV
jgi:D-3-phosphoglycerate dehydrogenase